MKKLLLEEALFEDDTIEEIPEDDTQTEEPAEGDIPEEPVDDIPVEDDTAEEESSEEGVAAGIASEVNGEDPEYGYEEGEDLQTLEPETTTYKVTFTLGKHTNWSKVDTVDEEDAKQMVADYVTKKWPDREFKITNVEEFEDVQESLNESVNDAQPIEMGPAVGMASVINDLIKGSYDMIDSYNSAIATAAAENYMDMVDVLSELQAEENVHIGQLQSLMSTVDPNAHFVDDSRVEM